MTTDDDLDVPVAFFIYRRPRKTAKVFSKIAEAQPDDLYVIAGGPREDVEDDPRLCQETRAQIEVDWDGELHTKYYSENQGIFRGIYDGLEWVFDQEDRAIILEDDCLASQSFFQFCSDLLNYYEDDDRVMSITGYNRQTTWKEDRADYHFSYHPCAWGWASWSDAWEKYDPFVEQWGSEFIQERVQDCLGLSDRQFWTRKHWYDNLYEKDPDDYHSWDGQWSFAHHVNSGLAAFPSKNLIENIGFDERATHTTDPRSDVANKDTFDYTNGISRVSHVTVDRQYDRLINEAKSYHILRQYALEIRNKLPSF